MNRFLDSLEFIEKNLTENITLEQVAKSCGYGPFYYCRMFKQITGENFSNYLTKRRLSMAAISLIETDERIIELGMKYQFNSQAAFTKAFKVHFKTTPNAIRKSKSYSKKLFKRSYDKRFIELLDKTEKFKPRIGTIEAATYTGLSIDFREGEPHRPFYLWCKFLFSLNVIKKLSNSDFYFGIIKSPEDSLFSGNLTYNACVRTDNLEQIPPKFNVIKLDTQKYAIFDFEGKPSDIRHVYYYIFSTWMFKTNYKFEKEYILHIVKPGTNLIRKKLLFDICIPIEE